jgi:outer membrane protein OmpU
MNKLTKVGLSALCGSLAAASAANAGELAVTGGATATYVSNEGTVTGNPIGMSTGITFSGSGELDNGSTVTLSITNTDKMGYSAANVKIDTPSMGTITIDQGAGGSGIDRYDDMIPTAREETNGTSLGTGLRTVGGVSGSANIEWNVSSDMLPDGLGVAVALTPKADGAVGASDKASGGSAAEGVGAGWDVAVEHGSLVDGLKVFAGYSEIEQVATTAGYAGDRTQEVLGATYAVGGVTFGYQYSKDNLNMKSGTDAYENTAYGVSFSVNDDLSISYGVHESEAIVLAATNVTNEGESLQVSYTMGGATFIIAESSVKNQDYVSTTTYDRDGTTVVLSLAF